ncbi:MAG: HEPN domain-containing protein [Candidatus Desantisbacteria bacterium]
MKHHEQALRLLKKATEDEILLDEVLLSTRISDEIFGFHSQQAVEKLLKAVLSELKIEYRRTHDIHELLCLLIDNGITLPVNIEDIDILSPYAVEWRYDMLPEETESPFDRKSIMETIVRVRIWAEKMIDIDSN